MEYLDALDLMSDELDGWEDIWDKELSPYQNTVNLLNRCIILPQPEVQLPIQVVAMWANTKWCRQLPVVFNYGSAGTGKSTAALISRSMHSVELLSASSTYASIRNAIKTSRYLDEEDEARETDGALLAFDNVNPSTFDDEDTRNVFLMGNKRGTDRVAHAGKMGGGNVYFSCFCLKMFSSIHPIHARTELSELLRRMVIIFHEKVENFSGDLLDPEDINWDNFYEDVYYEFYQSKLNLAMFSKAWKSAKQCKYSGDCWDLNRKALCRDLIATGVVIGAWPDVPSGIKAFAAYWEMFDARVKNTSNDFVQFLQGWVAEKPFIAHPELSNQIDRWVAEKRILEKPKPAQISQAMGQFGFTKQLDLWSRKQ